MGQDDHDTRDTQPEPSAHTPLADDDNEAKDSTENKVTIGNFGQASRYQFYDGGERGQLLDVLPLLHYEKKNLVIIEAPKGYGKTCLAQQAHAQTEELDNISSLINGSDYQALEQIDTAKKIAQSFQLDWQNDDSNTPGEQLGELIFKKNSQPLINLVIDDAQLLSLEAVQVIRQLLESSQLQKCQVILFTEPNAENLMADSAWKSYVSKHAHLVFLRKLTAKETEEYIRFLLVCSERQSVQFSRQDIQRIYQQTKGIPGLINDEVVYGLQQYDQQPDESKGGIVPKWHLVAISVVAVAVIALIIFGNPSDDSNTKFSDTIVQMGDVPQDNRPIKRTNPEDEYSRDSYASNPQANNSDDSNIEFTDFGQDNNSRPEPINDNRYDRPAAVNTPPSRSSRSSNREEEMSVNPPPQSDKISEKVAQLRSKRQDQPDEAAQAQPEVSQKPTRTLPQTENTQQVAATNPAAALNAKWLKGMPTNHYTLQLLGGANEGAVKKFVKEHGAFYKMGYFQTQRQGKPWYVVVYGDFPSRANAEKAVAELPQNLRSSNPWPRSAQDVHSDMN